MDQVEIDFRIKQQIKVIQIIAIALMMGVLTFGAIAFQLGQEQQPPETPMMSYFAVGFGIQMLVLHFVVPMLISKNQFKRLARQTGDIREGLIGIHRVKTIVAFALLEGAAFFSLVSYIAEGHMMALGTAISMVFFMSVAFPGRSRVLNWIESNAEAIQQQRDMS
jgi:hypothetical protein